MKRAVFLLALLAFFMCVYASPYATSDTLWSAMLGNWMLAHHSIPLSDYWTWTYQGKAWTAQEWLFDVLLALAAKGGYLIVVLMMTIVSLATWLLLAKTLKTKEVSYPHIWAFSAALLSLSWDQIRAETFSYLFIAFSFWVLIKERQKHTKWLYALIPLELVWVNLHGSFVIGLVFVGWELINSLISHRQNIKGLVVTLIGMFVASMANPHGPEIYKFVVWLSLKTNISKYIAEWQSPNVHENFGFAIFLAFGMAVAYCFKRVKEKEKIGVQDTLLMVFLLYMFLKANRFAPYLLLWLPIWASGSFRYKLPQKILDKLRSELRIWTPITMIALCTGFAGMSITVASKTHGSLATNADMVLEPKSLAFVEKLHIEHPTWKVWNSYNIGGTLEYSGIPASIDGRTDLYLADGGMQTYTNIISAKQDGIDKFDELNANIVYIEKNTALSEALNLQGDWKKEYSDAYYDVFVRTGKRA